MKRILIFILCCTLLAGCRSSTPEECRLPADPSDTSELQQTTTETYAESIAATVPLTLYLPNENVDGFITLEVAVEDMQPQCIVDALIREGVLNPNIAVNDFRLEDGTVYLDFNSAFLEQLMTYGTTGELMMVGSVVNTFLTAYGAEAVFLTADGQIMESGHVIYDFPLEFYE